MIKMAADHVQSPGGVDGGEQLLVEGVVADQPEADEADLNDLVDGGSKPCS